MIVPFFLDLVLLLTAAETDLDDRDLARRIKQGDQAAFKAFFDRHHELLFRYLRRRGVDAPMCEDILQRAFLTIWERRDQIDENQSLRSFLFRIAHNRALNFFRDTAKFAGEPTPEDHITNVLPDQHAEGALMQETLHRAVATLPERRRAVFELCFMQELTYREAAAALDISVKTVEHQMGHALKAIRKAMAKYV